MPKKNVNIEINMTNNCNCNCQYCFENCHTGFKRDIIEEDKQLKLLIDFCENFDKDRYDTLTISFWGGEPFLNIDFMFKILKSTYEYPFVRYHIYSNGTLIDKYEQFISQQFVEKSKDKIHIQLSYDGEPHHSLKRGNTKDSIFKVAHMLFDNEFTTMFKATLTFDMIPNLVEIWDSYNEAYDEFDGKISYVPTLDTRKADESMLECWEKKLIEIAQREYSFFKKHKRNLMSWFIDPMKCNCTLSNSIFIDIDGSMYICHGFSKKKDYFKVGTTKNTTDLRKCILDNSLNMFENYECMSCEAVHCAVCHVSNIHETTGDLVKDWIRNRFNDTARCKYYQIFGKIYNAYKLGLMI